MCVWCPTDTVDFDDTGKGCTACYLIAMTQKTHIQIVTTPYIERNFTGDLYIKYPLT